MEFDYIRGRKPIQAVQIILARLHGLTTESRDIAAEGLHDGLHAVKARRALKGVGMQGVQAIAVLHVQGVQSIQQADTLRLVIGEHFADQQRRIYRVLIAHIAAAQVAVAFLKAENIAVRAALLFKQTDLFTDELEARQHVDGAHAVMGGDTLGHIGGNDGFDHHRLRWHGMMGGAARTDEIQQQHTCLVASQQHVFACGIAHGNACAVAVGIGSQQQVGLMLLRAGNAQRHGLADFRVGVRAGGKMPVRLLLLGHNGDACKAAFAQRAGDRLKPRAVKRGIDDGYVPVDGIVRRQHGLSEHGTGEVIVYAVRNPLDAAVRQAGVEVSLLHVGKDVQLLDFAQNFIRRFGSDLAAVGTVYLVAVILGRVMRGRYHHARGAAQRPHGKGQAGRGHQLGIDKHRNAVCGKYARSHARKQTGLDARIIADGDAARIGRKPAHHIIGQPLGGLGHGVHVHAVSARADYAAQAACAKGKVAVKGVRQGRLILRHGGKLTR